MYIDYDYIECSWKTKSNKVDKRNSSVLSNIRCNNQDIYYDQCSNKFCSSRDKVRIYCHVALLYQFYNLTDKTSISQEQDHPLLS